MTYLQELMAAHRARVVRLNRRAPAAGPLVIKPRPRIIKLDRYGDRIADAPPKPALPNFPPLPGPPKMPTLAPWSKHRVSIAQVIHVVAVEFGLSTSSLLDRSSRIWPVCRPRQVAMFIAHDVGGLSLPEIGRRMGGFDHTTVLNAKRAVIQRMALDADLASRIVSIKATLDAAAP